MSKTARKADALPHPAGPLEAKRFLRKPFALQCDDGSVPKGCGRNAERMEPTTNRPELYRRRMVRARLLPVLAALPKVFFDRLAVDRGLSIDVSALASGLWSGPPTEIEPGVHGSRTIRMISGVTGEKTNSWSIQIGRIAIELCPPDAFAGIVIHECCHVYLGHEGDDAIDDEATIQRREDEAVALACRIGFHRETAAYINFYRETFGEAGCMGRLPPQA